MTRINIRRVYSDPDGSERDDGFRVFVDRLWPRGESKEKFHYDLWAKNISPSTELREWFHADPGNRWDVFRQRYMAELEGNPYVKDLITVLRGKPLVTLLYGSRDTLHNNAEVLADFLSQKLS